MLPIFQACAQQDVYMSSGTQNLRNSGTHPRGFTLIELLVAISLTTIIMGAIYFSFNAALASWQEARDELALQQAVSGWLEDILEGTDWAPGLRAALELSEAQPTRVSFVRPWSEEQRVSSGQRSFQLTQYVKSGAGLPTAELRLPDTKIFRPIPVAFEDPDNLTERPRLRPGFELVPESAVRFSYYPDPARVPEAVTTLRWDAGREMLIREQGGVVEELADTLFGVTMTDCRFRYADQTNAYLVEAGDVPEAELPVVTAVDVQITGRVGARELTLVGMVMLRNSPRHSGLIILREGLRVPVPDSRAIRTLILTNFTGITHGDELQLEIRPHAGRGYRVTVRFERYGQARPVIGQVTVESPPGQVLFTERPRTSAELGLDLLSLGPSGLYDYDDDPGIKDTVFVEGEPVTLTVTKMDIQGAACFVQP